MLFFSVKLYKKRYRKWWKHIHWPKHKLLFDFSSNYKICKKGKKILMGFSLLDLVILNSKISK